TLRARQELAVRELVEGRTMADAARVAGVGRSTLYRWLREPEFRARLNAFRADVDEVTRTMLHAKAIDAAQLLGDAVEGGDVKSAIALLKGLGLLSPSAPGS